MNNWERYRNFNEKYKSLSAEELIEMFLYQVDSERSIQDKPIELCNKGE